MAGNDGQYAAIREKTKLNYRPINSRVVLQLDPGVTKTETGLLHLPSNRHTCAFWGTVISVGPGRLITEGPRAGQRVPMEVALGDRVMYGASPITGNTANGFEGGNTVEWLDEDRRIVSIEEADCAIVQGQQAA
jgi:co-chaperonin GroES (HSP10)